jgi:hypothetical protein
MLAIPVFQGCDDERQATLATGARKLGRVARTGLACTKATALMTLAALEAVMYELP